MRLYVALGWHHNPSQIHINSVKDVKAPFILYKCLLVVYDRILRTLLQSISLNWYGILIISIYKWRKVGSGWIYQKWDMVMIDSFDGINETNMTTNSTFYPFENSDSLLIINRCIIDIWWHHQLIWDIKYCYDSVAFSGDHRLWKHA